MYVAMNEDPRQRLLFVAMRERARSWRAQSSPLKRWVATALLIVVGLPLLVLTIVLGAALAVAVVLLAAGYLAVIRVKRLVSRSDEHGRKNVRVIERSED